MLSQPEANRFRLRGFSYSATAINEIYRPRAQSDALTVSELKTMLGRTVYLEEVDEGDAPDACPTQLELDLGVSTGPALDQLVMTNSKLVDIITDLTARLYAAERKGEGEDPCTCVPYSERGASPV